MKKGLIMIVLVLAAALIMPFQCQCRADDAVKLAALKKIKGTYVPKRLDSRSDLGGREITFSFEGNYLIILEECLGQSKRQSRIPLSEISEKEDVLTFGHNFQGDISTSHIEVHPQGKLSGWSGRCGHIAEIEFKKK